MLRRPSWAQKKDEVEDQITITKGPIRMGYSTGAGSDGVVQPNRRAMLDLTEFHEGEEVIPHKTVRMAGGHENVREAVAEEVQENSYKCGGTVVRSYQQGGAVGTNVSDYVNKPVKTVQPQAPKQDWHPQTTQENFKPAPTTPTVSLDKPQQSLATGTIKPPDVSVDLGKPTQDVTQTKSQEPVWQPIQHPEFKKTEVDSKITVDPTIKTDPKYKQNIDQAIAQTKDIARGESKVADTIAKRAHQEFDTRAQSDLNLLKMRIANDPNMSEGQKRAAIASAMRDIGSSRAGMTGDLAQSNMERAESAMGRVAQMSGAQQAFEAANEKFRITQETANQMFEKKFDYTQDYNNNVKEYMVSKDRFDFEYKSAKDQANAALEAGDYDGANKAYSQLGFNIDFSKAVDAEERRIQMEKMDLKKAEQGLKKGEQDIEMGDIDIQKGKKSLELTELDLKQARQKLEGGELELEAMKREAEREAEQKIGDSSANLITSITNGLDFDNDLVQHDLKRLYEGINGEGTATGPDFEKWAKDQYDSVKVATHPIYGPVKNFDDQIVEDMLRVSLNPDNDPSWSIDDYEYAGAKGVEAGKKALTMIMAGKGYDPETGEPNYDDPVWDIMGRGPETREAQGTDTDNTTDTTYQKTGDVLEDAPKELKTNFLDPIKAEMEKLNDVPGVDPGVGPGQRSNNVLQKQAEDLRNHLTGLTKEQWEPILSDPNIMHELKNIGIVKDANISTDTIKGADDAKKLGLNFKVALNATKRKNTNIKTIANAAFPQSIVIVDGVPYQLETYDYYNKKQRGLGLKSSEKAIKITGTNLLNNTKETIMDS